MQVKLKELVDYVADVTACNTAAWAATQLVPPELERSGAALAEAAEALVALVANEQGAGGAGGVDSMVRQYLSNLGEQQIADATASVLSRGQAMAEERLRESAVRALVALTPLEHGEAVVGTAAAIAAEVAAMACAQRLLAQVPSAIRQGVKRQIDVAIAAFAKGSRVAAQQAAATLDQDSTTAAQDQEAAAEIDTGVSDQKAGK